MAPPIGFVPWNKGKKNVQVPWNKNVRGYHIHSTEWKENLSKISKLRKHTEETKKIIAEKNSVSLTGRKLSEEHRQSMSLERKKRYANGSFKGTSGMTWKLKSIDHLLGENNGNWGGGIKKRNPRNIIGYRLFRKNVIERDGKKCTVCESTERLEIHHLIPFSQCIDNAKNIDNCVTLCRECHKKTETYGGRIKRKIIC